MLDIECFSFLNRALESDKAPIVILATNRGITQIRGTNYKSPHGIPIDLLDRLVIIHTKNYSEDELAEILQIRCEEEDVEMDDDAKELLVQIAQETSLRYSIQLITTSYIVAQKKKKSIVGVEELRKVYTMFADVKRSMEYLNEQSEQYLYSKGGMDIES
jgi:RuvB-like protein 2